MPKYIVNNLPNITKVRYNGVDYTFEWEVSHEVNNSTNEEYCEASVNQVYPTPENLGDIPIIHSMFHEQLKMEMEENE